MSIEVRNVSKSFGDTVALGNVSVTFEKSKIYGLLGRNGAGKSTLLNIITNKLFANSGEVLVDGKKATENDCALSKIYMMSEKKYYPEGMRVAEAFKWSKEFYPSFNMEYANKLAEKFGLNTRKKMKELSTGYNSIFKIIVGLSVELPYVLFDEPVLGLDANHRELFYRLLIENYNENPKTFIISTHLIEEVAGVIEEIVIIDKGTIIKNESCEMLLAQGYAVSGVANDIDRFIIDKSVIGAEALGGLKTAYIWGSLNKEELPERIEASRLDLQRLFIHLTNEGEL